MRKKFLSVLLSLAMLLSLLPAPASAATVDGLPNATGTEENKVIKLSANTIYKLSDCSPEYPIEVGTNVKNVTLQVTGSLTVKAPITINAGGGLTISGSGQITAAEDDKITIINNEGTLRITDNVKINGAAGNNSVIINEGALTINGKAAISGTSENCPVIDNQRALTIAGDAQITGGDVASVCILSSGTLNTLEVSGGTISGGKTGIAVSGGTSNIVSGGTISGGTTGIEVTDGALTVSGGTVSGDTGVSVIGGELTVSGGIIKGQTSSGSGIAVSPLSDQETTVTVGQEGADNSGISISGKNALSFDSTSGTIKAQVFSGTFKGEITRSGNTPAKFITGGKFSDSSAGEYLDASNELAGPIDGFYQLITAGSQEKRDGYDVAKVEGGKHYPTVEAAVTAAQSGDTNTERTVTLVEDSPAKATGNLVITKKVKINLGGKRLISDGPITVKGPDGSLTLTSNGGTNTFVANLDISSIPQTVVVQEGGSLTVDGATIMNQVNSGSGVTAAILVKDVGSNVTIKNDGKVQATGAGGIGVCIMNRGKLDVTKGAITAEKGCAVYQPEYGTTSLSGCQIKGEIGVAARDGKININNCVIQATGAEGNEINVGDDRFLPAGVVFHQGTGSTLATITITDGEVRANGKYAIRYAINGTYYYEGSNTAEPGLTDGRIEVKGGGSANSTGLFSSSVSRFVDSTYKFEAKNSDGYRYYTVLADAVTAVKDSGTDGAVNSLDKESPVYNVRFYLNEQDNGTSSTALGTLFKQGNDTGHYVDASTKQVKDEASVWSMQLKERPGYTFGGWYTVSTDSGGIQIVQSGGNANTVKSLDEFLKGADPENIPLFARWIKDGEFRVGSVTGKAYESLKEAVAEASGSSVFIYTVANDVTLNPQDIPNPIGVDICIGKLDQALTLNLRGSELNFTGNHGLVIDSSAPRVTVANGKIVSDGTAMTVKGSSSVYATGSDVTITGSNAGIEVNGGTLTVGNGVKITGNKDKNNNKGVILKSGALAVQNGAVITGTTYGIEVQGGTLTVQGGEISGGNALYFSGSTIKADVSGGTFRGADGTDAACTSVVVAGTAPQDGFIHGGTFLKAGGTMDPLPEKYLDTDTIQLDTGKVVPRDGIAVIKFDANGGTFDEDADDDGTVKRKIDKGSALPEAQWPTLKEYKGHAFLGWYTEKKGGDKVSTAYKFTADTTLHAHWGYPITFDARPGKFNKDGTYAITVDTDEDGILGKLPDDPTHDKYTFAGWYIVGEDTQPVDLVYNHQFTKDTTVYAHWGYQITFDAKGGILTGDETAMTDEEGILPEDKRPSDPIRNGFVFDGWYAVGVDTALDFSIYRFTEDTTVTAQWTKDPNSPVYVITFDATPGVFEGGSHTATRDTDEYSILKDTVLPKATLSGYDFDYWYEVDADTKVDFSKPFTGNTTLYAHWTKKDDPVYTITFDANGGIFTGAETATTNSEGKLSELPADPTRDGYTFDGWYTEKVGGEKISTAYTFMDDTTVYAHWTEKAGGESSGNIELSYSISIASSSHGNVVPSSMSAKSGSTVVLTLNPDTDYEVSSVSVRTASGTSVTASRSGNRYSFTMPTADVTVSASFSLRPEYSFVPPQQTQSQSQPQTNTHTSLPASAFTPPTWRPAAAMKDVPTSSWAYPAAQWAYQNGYLDTAADGTFRLNDTVSHMQLWKIMARWLGESALDDNSVTQWARKSGAARIAVSSSSVMTRQDMVEYLYQCYFLMGGDVSVTGNLIQYRDGQQVTSGSARNAWLWAVNKGIINGSTDGYLNPNKVLSRAEFASILMRLCQNG